MLQTLSSAFLAQFQNDEGQALTVVSESIPINDKIEVPFVLDNSVGRQVLARPGPKKNSRTAVRTNIPVFIRIGPNFRISPDISYFNGDRNKESA